MTVEDLAPIEELLSEIAGVVSAIQESDVVRGFLSTPIKDYSVAEGLLLLILLVLILSGLSRFLRWLFEEFF